MKELKNPKQLSAFLRKNGVSKSATDVLEASDVTGPLLLAFTRSDLSDLFPDAKAFVLRKKIWDLIEDLKKDDDSEEQDEALHGGKYENWREGVRYSPPISTSPASVASLPLSTASVEFDDDLFSCTQTPKLKLKRPKTSPSTIESSKKKCLSSPVSPASTVSVPVSMTSDQDLSDSEIECSQVPKIERSKKLSFGKNNQASVSGIEQSTKSVGDVEDRFKFPLSKEVKMCVKEKKELSKKAREQLIREAFTCLQVACESTREAGEIKEEDFKMAAKKLCSKVPMLKDKQPPSWPLKKPFSYWSTVMYQLKRRSQNIKFQEKKSISTNHEDTPSCSEETKSKDVSDILKEMNKEFKRKKPNFKALREMQRLTFPRRKEFIEDCDGRTTVETVLSAYPFLKSDEMMLNELLLYLEDAGVKTDVDQMKLNFDKIKHCFKEVANDEDLKDGEYIERMQTKFSLKQPFLLFIPEETEDVEQYIRLQNISTSPILAAFVTEFNTQYFVVVDKKLVLTIESEECLDALLLLMATYFVFNLAYDKQFNDALLFIQTHILGLTPKRKSITFRKLENYIFK